jgi:hypothetical protein
MDGAPYRCMHGQLNGLGPQCYSKCRQVVEPAPVTVESTPKEKRRALKVRKPEATVSDARTVSDGATRTARWRSKQDPEALKQRNRDAVQRYRTKRKAATSAGKEK